jgi:hypothetical protein
VHGGAYVHVDQPELVLEIGLLDLLRDERPAGADARVQGERVDRAADALHELLHAVLGGEIHLDRVRRHAGRANAVGDRADVIVFSRDDHVELRRGEQLGKLEADAAGGTGDDGQGARRRFHTSPVPRRGANKRKLHLLPQPALRGCARGGHPLGQDRHSDRVVGLFHERVE